MISLLLALVLGPTPFSDIDEWLIPNPWAIASDSVPDEAARALEQGRYWRASKILRSYLATVPDTAPESILMIAKTDAGWGDWTGVEKLLAGRSWLDTAESGAGWGLLGQSQLALGRWSESEYALSRYLELATDAGERERGLAEARRAKALVEVGSYGEAAEAYQRATEYLPQIGDWLKVLGADAAARRGDTTLTRVLLGETDRQLARDWGWRIEVRAFTEAGDLAAAQRIAEGAANQLSSPSARATAWTRVGQLRRQRGDETGARTAFRRAISAAPQSLAALDAARGLLELGEVGPDDHLKIGRLYLRHGNTERGIAGLEAYLGAGGMSALERAQLRLEIGRGYFRGGRYAEAEGELDRLLASGPPTRVGADASYLKARAQYRQGKVEAAKATLRKTAADYPDQGAATEALFLLGDLDHDVGKIESARAYYSRAAVGQANLNETGLAAMRLGGLAFLEGDYRGAAEVFEGYRARHPNGRRIVQATYWAGKAYHELGEAREAVRRFREVRRRDPFSWYGIRAAEYLNEDFFAISMEPAPAVNPRIAEEIEAAFARIDLLRELELNDAVSFEIERLKGHFSKTDGANYALAEAFNERGHTMTGIRMGWEIYRQEGAWNPRLLRIIYPFPYKEMVMAEARERGLDPFFVAGLIRQESTFSARIRSPAGAIGLMQIMPATGRALAQGAGVGGFEPELLERPELNLHLGMNYLAELLERYGGRVAPALAAYNAGPHRLSFWSTFPEYQDEELFAERIPFAETRNYVKIVQQNASLYARLYTDEGTLSPLGGRPASDGEPR